MKKTLMAAVILAALSSTPALAQSANFTVSASVAASCGAITDDPIAFGTLTINSDGTLGTGQSKTNAGQAVYCNGANSTITVSHDAMKIGDGSGSPSGFTKTIDYTTAVNFAGVQVTDGTGLSLGAKTGTLTVSANNLTAGGLKPLAGSYVGAVHVTLTPAS